MDGEQDAVEAEQNLLINHILGPEIAFLGCRIVVDLVVIAVAHVDGDGNNCGEREQPDDEVEGNQRSRAHPPAATRCACDQEFEDGYEGGDSSLFLC
jgi:hypothetical protein